MSKITEIYKVREGVEIVFEEQRGMTNRTYINTFVIDKETLDKIISKFKIESKKTDKNSGLNGQKQVNTKEKVRD